MKDRLSGDDLLEMGIKPGEVSSTFVPEQERNFDNQTMPERDRMVMKGYEVIDGKTYKVWQA